MKSPWHLALAEHFLSSHHKQGIHVYVFRADLAAQSALVAKGHEPSCRGCFELGFALQRCGYYFVFDAQGPFIGVFAEVAVLTAVGASALDAP